MNKIFLFCLCTLAISCTLDTSRNQVSVLKQNKMIVTNYTGNAVVFFSKDDFDYLTFIPIQEKDSNVFKNPDFDIWSAIKGRCLIRMYAWPKYKIQLLENKSRRRFENYICNVTYKFRYYSKIWISYKGYAEGPYRKNKEPQVDSCSVRYITSNPSDSAEWIDFKILE